MSIPESPQKKPFILKGEQKTYAWCACGLSQNQPFCDGSHKVTDFKPVVIKNEKTGNIAWCGCKRTGNQPFCDGTHSKL